jgi:hypothetical protein
MGDNKCSQSTLMVPVLKMIFFYLNDVSSDNAGENCSNFKDSNDFTNFSNVAMAQILIQIK